jgi:hypothetical protein
MKLSNPEQQLVAFASNQFGHQLTQFLLAGLGEEKVGQRLQLTITYIDSDGTQLGRDIQVMSHEPEDGSSCLPRGRDPLVFLALLKLLILGDQPPNYRLRYEQKDVLKTLGWEDTSATRREMDETIRRYFLMMFKWEMNPTELAREKLSFYTAMKRPISESQTIDEEEGGQVRRIFNQINFNETFIERLKHRRLFDIDWEKVQSLKISNHVEGLNDAPQQSEISS